MVKSTRKILLVLGMFTFVGGGEGQELWGLVIDPGFGVRFLRAWFYNNLAAHFFY